MDRVNRTLEILYLAPVDWAATVERMSTEERYELERAIVGDAVQLARFSAYIGRRITGGNHAAGVKRQNQVARKVRQALGYTYADDAITF